MNKMFLSDITNQWECGKRLDTLFKYHNNLVYKLSCSDSLDSFESGDLKRKLEHVEKEIEEIILKEQIK